MPSIYDVFLFCSSQNLQSSLGQDFDQVSVIAVGSQGKGLCPSHRAADVWCSRARKFTLWGWATGLGGKPHRDWFAESMRILDGDGGCLRNTWEGRLDLMQSDGEDVQSQWGLWHSQLRDFTGFLNWP